MAEKNSNLKGAIFKILLVLLHVATVLSRPVLVGGNGDIINYQYKPLEDGYIFQYLTHSGISRVETGRFVNSYAFPKTPGGIFSIYGIYSYTDDKGINHKVEYYGDESGSYAQVPRISEAALASLGG